MKVPMLYLANVANPMVWIAVAIVVLVLFGSTKIPELMKGVGTGMREFKKGLHEDDDELRKEREKTEKEKSEKKD